MKPLILINEIKQLFPPDAEYLDTAATGRRLMAEAIEEIGWENLPEEMLRLFYNKCMAEEQRQAKNPYR